MSYLASKDSSAMISYRFVPHSKPLGLIINEKIKVKTFKVIAIATTQMNYLVLRSYNL